MLTVALDKYCGGDVASPCALGNGTCFLVYVSLHACTGCPQCKRNREETNNYSYHRPTGKGKMPKQHLPTDDVYEQCALNMVANCDRRNIDGLVR